MSTRAIRALVQILQDPNIFRRKRIEACEGLLGYEAPHDVAQLAKEFLASVFEDEEADVSDRLDATALTRKFEAAKVMPQTAHLTRRDEIDRKEAWRKHEIEQRRWRLILAIHQIPPSGYADDLRSPDYLPPPGDHWPPGSGDRPGRLKVVFDKDKERG